MDPGSSSAPRQPTAKRKLRKHTTVGALGHDVLCMIFSLLDLVHLIRCSAVCKSWSIAIRKLKLLQIQYQKQHQIDAATFSNASAYSETLLNIHLEQLAMDQHKFSLQEGPADIFQWKGHLTSSLLGRDTAGDWRENALEIDTKLLGIFYHKKKKKKLCGFGNSSWRLGYSPQSRSSVMRSLCDFGFSWNSFIWIGFSGLLATISIFWLKFGVSSAFGVCPGHLEFRPGYLEFGSVHLKFGPGYLEFGSVHLKFGPGHLEFGPVYLEFGLVLVRSIRNLSFSSRSFWPVFWRVSAHVVNFF